MRRIAAFLVIASSIAAAQRPDDTTAVRRIKAEGLDRSEVMEIAHWLTDVFGPRLTGSPANTAAGEWAMARMRAWGLSAVHAEPFVFKYPSWTNERFFARVVTPWPYPILGAPSAWSSGTDSLVRADLAIVRIRQVDDTARFKGKLRGKAVLVTPPTENWSLESARTFRFTRELLDEMQQAGKDWIVLRKGLYREPSEYRSEPPVTGTPMRFWDVRNFLAREGVAAEFRTWGGVGGNFSTGGTTAMPFPQIDVAPEHYSRMYRTVESGNVVTIELDVRNRVSAGPATPFHVLAEIPGTDKRDEIVLIGAHLDSWTGGTGATDNAAGVAVMMEAIRILKATKLPLRRTVRIALWNGEEQFIGSYSYVAEHLVTSERQGVGSAARRVLFPKAAAALFSGYFNLDQGAGAIRGIDTYGNKAAVPIFQQWLPLLAIDSISVGHVLSIGNEASDSDAFDSSGLPAFYFNQDPLDYIRGTHHTTQDVFDRLVPEYLKHNAIVVAAVVYLVANREQMLPRKPTPP